MSGPDELQRMTTGPKRKRKWLIRFAAVLGALALVWLILAAHARIKLTQEIAAARRSGDPLTFEEIKARRPPIPDEENGALVLQALFDSLEPLSKNRDPAVRSLLLGDKKLPPPGEPLDATAIAAARSFLAERADLLRALDRMIDYPAGRFDVQIADDPVQTLLPHLMLVRTAVRLKALDALIKAIDGRMEDAVRDARIILNMAATLEDGGVLISTLVYAAATSAGVGSLERWLSLGECPGQTLRELNDVLQRHEESSSLRWGLLGERALQVEIFRAAQIGKYGRGGGLPVPVPALSWLNAWWLQLNQAQSISFMSRLVEVAKAAENQLARVEQLDAEARGISRLYLMTRLIMPSLQRTFVHWLRRTAELRCARVALAVERYRLAHGGWPESLEALLPEYLDAVPPDPFDGRPLRYRATEERAVVYSVGENLGDDGGLLDPPAKGQRNPDQGFRLLHPRHRTPRFAEPPASAPAEEESDFP